MVYDSLTFPVIPSRPFFYTNFVATVDGKVQVTTDKQSAYWPIGSKTDYATLLQLRTYADVLIYGKNSALHFNHGENLAKESFKHDRKNVGKNENIIYLIICNTTSGLAVETLTSPHNAYTYLVFPEDATVDEKFANTFKILRFGKAQVDITLLTQWLHEQQHKHVLVEGGPTLLGTFFDHDLIDEVFLTIAPKIFGNETGKTLTLVEHKLFSPEKVKNLTLLSVKQVQNELFLRYAINH